MNFESRITAGIFAFGAALSPAVVSASAIESLVASFSNDSAGAYPVSGLIRDTTGNLYGTTSSGGTSGNGAIFEITVAGNLVTLYSFKGGNDGGFPNAGLLRDAAGNLFGTTSAGGTSNFGTVFELSASGSLTTLYAFGNGSDGAIPNAGLTADGLGKYYGTTSAGGTSGYGTVFSINTSGSGFSTLYTFTNGSDGGIPGALTTDGLGNFFGVTAAGGANAYGTVFELTGSTLTTLHSFEGSDGANPLAALVYASDGALYGTTPKGGSGAYGTVFRLVPAGLSSSFSSLYSFADGSDGAASLAGLIQGEDGSLFGATSQAGGNGSGGVFQISTLGVFTPLYSLAGATTDGLYPVAGLVYGSAGNFYGTTVQGGASNDGAVYRLTVSPTAPTKLVASAGDTEIILNWTAGAYAASYNIYQGTKAGGESATPVATGINSTTATISALANGTAYYFTVASVNGAGVSSTSSEASATPVPPPPAVNLSPSALNFAQRGQAESGFTAPQTVTLTDTGKGPLNISGITVTGEFQQTNNCPALLAPGASCTISVVMATSLDTLNKSGSLIVASDASPAQASVPLSGTISGKGGSMPFWLLLPGLAAFAARRRKQRC